MANTYGIEAGKKVLQFDDGSRADVVAVMDLLDGTSVKLIPLQDAKLDNLVNYLNLLRSTQAGNFQRVLQAADMQQTFTYLDAGDPDERLERITYTSASLQLSITETYQYAGSAGSYRLTRITRS